ncbi:MAG: EAL domain-containing protein [Paucibacter sp.]|nr:EAL domain-containing protein [Roseateles sp.]
MSAALKPMMAWPELPVATAGLNIDARVLRANAAFEALGLDLQALPADQLDALRRALQQGQGFALELQCSATGVPRSLLCRAAPADFDGETVTVWQDFTPWRGVELALRESEQRLEKFMLATVEGILVQRGDLVLDVNQPLADLLACRPEDLVGCSMPDLLAPDERERVQALMAHGGEHHFETLMQDSAGQSIDVECIVRTMHFRGEPLRMTVIRDIRDRLNAQAHIHHLAHHDALTQLMNRTAFMQQLQVELEGAALRSGKRSMALLFIDLDNFKRVNDSLGHLEGDKVLRTVADRIKGCLRSTDLVARFGGDEFVVLLGDIYSRTDVQVVLMALLAVVEVPVRAEGLDLSVTPSIGVAMAPEHGRTAEELIQHADTAMYLAKASGRAIYRFFESVLAERAYADLVLEGELVQALTRGEFELFYQPQVDAQTAQVHGAEALLRWRHPERGLLSPDAFLNVAERHRLMLPLSEWVMREAAQQCRAWRECKLVDLRIAVNLSSMQFRLADFDKIVAQVLAEEGVPGEWLELELTERMLVDDIATAPETLLALRSQGLSISVDDFGTGYTSLAHLTQLSLDKLKIDQSFVAGLPGHAGASAITRAIVQMGLGLGLKVSAEGVRDEAQWNLLRDWGCRELQGECIGLPMSVAEFELWLQQWQAAHPAPL